MDSSKPDNSQPQPTLHFLDYWRIIRIRKTVIFTVFLLVVLTTTIVTFILPESYASTVEIEVKKDVSDIDPIGNIQVSQGFDPYFIQTEFEKIQSKSVLHRVIEKLELNPYYTQALNLEVPLKTEETYFLLRNDISLSQKRNTELIEVRVTNEDPNQAAKVANAIAAEYRAWRLDQSTNRVALGLTSMREQLKEQEALLKELEENVDELRRELPVADLFEGSGQNVLEMKRQSILQKQSNSDATSAEYNRTTQLLSALEQMTNIDELKVAIALSLPDLGYTTDLATLLQHESQLKRELAGLRTNFGPAHPDVMSRQAELDEVTEQIENLVGQVMNGLKKKAAAEQASLDDLNAEIAALDEELKTVSADVRPYLNAKEKYERQKNVVEAINLRMSQETIDSSLSRSSIVTVINQAEPGLRPAKPNKPLNIALGVVVGLVVGVGLAFFIEYLDTSVKTIDDVERALQTHVLGVIPQNVGSLLEEGADSPHAEAYRVLRTNILFSRKSEDHNTITVVSGGAGEGKSTTLFNLACIFAQNGAKVLIVDSDLRRPSIHKILKVSNSVGLTNILLKQNTLDEVIQTTGLETLDVMASGRLPSSSMGILSSVKMRELIQELRKRYDFVFFDSPPIMGVSDASVLASEVDVTLQVIQYRRYPQPMTIRAKQMIEKVGGNLLGVVLNNINMAQDENYYYYSGYYYDYYSKHKDEDEPAETAKGGTAKKIGSKEKETAKVDLKGKF